MKHLLLALFIACTVLTSAQSDQKEYDLYVKRADSLYNIHSYQASAFAYLQAFKQLDGKAYANDRYNAACSWAMAGYRDSAFTHLFKVANRAGYANYNHIRNDSDLESLHSDKRWPELMEIVKTNKDKAEAGFNKRLITLLDSMVTEDQHARKTAIELMNKGVPAESPERKTAFLKMHLADSLNYYVCRGIMNRYGFPNHNLIGREGTHNFWLLVQHQDLRPAFQDSVLQKMKPEVDKGLASGSDYAYLVDRVNVNTGRQQVYGTQMRLNKAETSYEPEPVIEPEKLNERRKAVGLGTIESYIETMNTHYRGSLKKQ